MQTLCAAATSIALALCGPASKVDGALPHDLTIAPALSVLAQEHLSELDRFYLFLGANQRLLPTNSETCRPIGESKKVAESEAALEAGRAAGGVREAETAVGKARKEAWGDLFKTVDPYSLSFAPYDPETGIATSVTEETAGAAAVFHPPNPFAKVFVHNRETLSSYHGQADPNQPPKEYYVLCCDCGSFASGSLNPGYEATFEIQHYPSNAGCPTHVSPNRSLLLRKDDHSPERLEELLDGLKEKSIVDPATGTRIYCPILIWYASIKTNLSTYDEIRSSIQSYLSPLPPTHPHYLLLHRLLGVSKNLLGRVLGRVLGSVTTEQETTSSARILTHERGVYHGFFSEAVRFTYSTSRKNGVRSEGSGKIPAHYFWQAEDDGARDDDDDEDDGELEDEDGSDSEEEDENDFS